MTKKSKPVNIFTTNTIPTDVIQPKRVIYDPFGLDIKHTRFVPWDIAHLGIRRSVRALPVTKKYDWDKRADIAKNMYEEAYHNDSIVTNRFNMGKKFALGGLDVVNTALSLGSAAVSVWNAANAKSDKKTSDNMAIQLAEKQRLEGDTDFLNNFNTSGSTTAFYRKGGMFKLNSRKTGNISKFKPIAPNTFEVQGPKHEQGGVPIGQSEVEGGEVIKITPSGVKVLSDSDDYFGYSPADNAKNNPINFDKEFNIQENMKKSSNNKYAKLGTEDLAIETKKPGFTFKPIGIADIVAEANPVINRPTYPNMPLKVADNTSAVDKKPKSQPYGGNYSIVPSLIDNVTNAITTSMTPNPSAPVMVPHQQLNTNIDVNPMLNAVTSNEKNVINNINRNISDSNVATALGISVGNNAIQSKNQILSNEVNAENELKNKEAEMRFRTNTINAQSIMDFNRETTLKRSAVNQMINENANNLSRDLIDMSDKRRMDEKDKLRVNLQLAQDTESSMSEIIKGGYFDQFITDPNFDTNILSGKNLTEASKRIALAKMKQQSKR